MGDSGVCAKKEQVGQYRVVGGMDEVMEFLKEVRAQLGLPILWQPNCPLGGSGVDGPAFSPVRFLDFALLDTFFIHSGLTIVESSSSGELDVPMSKCCGYGASALSARHC